MAANRWDERFFASTRGQVVTPLRRGYRTVDELAGELSLTDNAVRAHLASLGDIEYIKHFNKNGGLDVVQLEYSILNRKAERGILPYLQEHGIGG